MSNLFLLAHMSEVLNLFNLEEVKDDLRRRTSLQGLWVWQLKYSATQAPKVPRTSGKTNKRGPRKWVPKDKIIYLADILNSSIKTPVMVPGQWMLTTHDGRKAYVPKAGT